MVFRILLFKLFNRIETWELLESALGPIAFEDFDVVRYAEILGRARRAGHRLYSGAYIMPMNRRPPSASKHESHLELVAQMMKDDLPERLVETRTMAEGFGLLRGYSSIGDFLAYQLITDVNYSACTDFTEMEFVVPGPGARDGLRKCFKDLGGSTESDAIRMVTDAQEREFERLGLTFQTLWGRPLQLIDCQNLFCEIDKYARVAHPGIGGPRSRTRIKRKFTATGPLLPLYYPPKWNMNERLGGHDGTRIGRDEKRETSETESERQRLGMGDYQREAARTDQTRADDSSVMVPMLGLAGEAGQLLSEYKKRLRDGEGHRHFKDRVVEELGDLLWYVANVATKFGVDLERVARANLAKVAARWGREASRPLWFDDESPEGERLPRTFGVDLTDTAEGFHRRVRVTIGGEQVGDQLTDNSYDPDGYRFHDVFHFSYAAVLGWSPITRGLLRRKRKSRPDVDQVEDGGRAAVIEEGVAALVFDYARRHDMLREVKALDYQLLRTIKEMTSHLEVSRRTTGEWERAILNGFDVWRQVVEQNGGRIAVDLERREVRYEGRPAVRGG